MNGSEPKYSCSFIIPKADTETVGKIKQATEDARLEGVPKWGGKISPEPEAPLRDGDIDRPDDPNYADSYFINASSKEKPGFVDRKRVPINRPLDVYSGCYVRASLNIYRSIRTAIAASLRDSTTSSSGATANRLTVVCARKTSSTRWTTWTTTISSDNPIRTAAHREYPGAR